MLMILFPRLQRRKVCLCFSSLNIKISFEQLTAQTLTPSESPPDSDVSTFAGCSNTLHSRSDLVTEHTPLLTTADTGNAMSSFFSGHHRHESRGTHTEHGRAAHPRLSSFCPSTPCVCRVVAERSRVDVEEDPLAEIAHEHHRHQGHGPEREVVVGRKRQVVGILVRAHSFTRLKLC